ncbi:MAG: hypothetical protein Q8O01_01060 [Candidatus Omnitrophota bacterium]|nr:hypothetical protein [Candidatus Omnitrophota bacterium]
MIVQDKKRKKIIKIIAWILMAAFIAQAAVWANSQPAVLAGWEDGKGSRPALINRQLLGDHPFQEVGVRDAADTGKPDKPVPLSIAEIYNYLMLWLMEAHARRLGLGKVFGRIVRIPEFSRFSVIFKRGNFRDLLIHLLPLFAIVSLFIFIHWPGSDCINQPTGFITHYNEQISASVGLAIDKIQPTCSFSKNSLIIAGFFDFLGSNCMLSDMLNIPFVPFKSGYMQLSLLLRTETYFIRYLTKCQGEKPQALQENDVLVVSC